MKRENYILAQFTLYNTQQTKVSAFLSNLDKKLNTLLNYSRSAIPLPNLPTPFLDFLPLKSMNNLDLVEQILKPESENSNFNGHAKELVNYIIYLYKIYFNMPYIFCRKTIWFCEQDQIYH